MAGLLDKIFDQTTSGLGKLMDLTWQRNSALSSNIANAETPQYKAVDLNFAGELERAFNKQNDDLKKTNVMHINTEDKSAAHFIPDYSGVTKPDGNNVDIDLQMGRLSYNSGNYSAAARLLRRKLGILKTAIREGGR